MTSNGFFAVLICLFSYCGQAFDVVSANSQIYHAGRVESGGGINLEMVLVAQKSSKKLVIENISFNDEMLPVKVYNTKNEMINEFQKGDTLLVKSTKTLSSAEMALPIEFDDEYITLYYRYKKQEKIVWGQAVAKEDLYLP